MADSSPATLAKTSKSKASYWRIKGDKKVLAYTSTIQTPHSLTLPVSKNTHCGDGESTVNQISPRSQLFLSKAAKRAVFQQYFLTKSNPHCHHQNVKTSHSSRTPQKKPRLKNSARVEVCSAPILGKEFARDTIYLPNKPPRIVVSSAGHHIAQRNTDNSVICTKDKIDSKSALNLNTKPFTSREQTEFDFTPRSTFSTDSSCFLGAYSPDSKLSDRGLRSFDTPKSTVTFTDWKWVRERLASRESAIQRSDSSLTFYDFLETINLDSDEYDTELEDDFDYLNVDKEDNTGIFKYKKVCFEKGIALAKHVVKELSDENASLTLSHRYLNKSDTQALATALAYNKLVRTVDLNGNHINDEAAKPLYTMLRKNGIIKKFDLSNNCLKNDEQGFIARILNENSTLTHLNLSRNKLGDKEILLLSEALKNNYSLEYLNLSHNQLSDLAGQSIAAALMDNVFLTSLDLSWNILGKLAASALGKALKFNETLQSLDLSYNGFGDEGAALFGRCLRNNATLRLLSLAVNHIGSFGVEHLADGLIGSKKKAKKSKSNLKSLNLSRNHLGKKGVLTLLKYMEHTNKLQELAIEDVILSPEILMLIRHLTVVRDVAVFHDGQEQQEKQRSAIRFGVKFLRNFLQKDFKLQDFFDSIDPEGKGVASDQLKNSLENLPSSLSELELQHLLWSLYFRHSGPFCFEDIFTVNSLPSAQPSFENTEKTKLKKKSL